MSKYPWDEAPEWANYASTNWDGSRFWSENKPKFKDGYWLNIPKGKFSEIKNKFYENSLEERPVKDNNYSFREISQDEYNALKQNDQFISVTKYAKLVPIPNEVGSLASVKWEEIEGCKIGTLVECDIERLILLK
jgi:hypothetical protein